MLAGDNFIPSTIWGFLGILILLGLQYYAYVGILENAVTRSPSDKSLVGGASLDLLGVVLVVQFGSVLITPKLYWVLAALPPWAAYSLYRTFYGSSNNSGVGGGMAPQPPGAAMTASQKEEAEKLEERRQQRAERRRQKR